MLCLCVTPGPSTSVLVGVVVGLVIAGVLLAILLVLLCRYKNAKGPPSPRGPTWTPNRTKDLPRARLLMMSIHICSRVALTSMIQSLPLTVMTAMLVLLLLDQVM
ncbi:uncharacterized protein ACWYII_027652 [Salvelinus alpinus]